MFRLVRFAPAAILALILLMEVAAARVGGGQGFSSGSGGGGSSGGGGGEVLFDILFLLVHLCIEVPEVGIPLLLLFLAGVAIKLWYDRRTRRWTIRSSDSGSRRPVHRSPPGLDELKKSDGAFSIPVLIDFVQLVYRRAHSAHGDRRWPVLAPFVDPRIQDQMQRSSPGVDAFEEIVIAQTRIERVLHKPAATLLTVRFHCSKVEIRGTDKARVYTEEDWVFRRQPTALSLPPDKTLRLGCPSCGAAIETDTLGACTNCGTPITKGQLQWQAIQLEVRLRRPVQAPSVARHGAGEELGYKLPTVVDPSFAAQARAFNARHPEFDVPAFQARAKGIFEHLQAAWSEGRWEGARPNVTDALFQTLRFWIEDYERAGLRNRLDEVKLLKQQLVKIEIDPWYEAITLRVWASCIDSVIDRASGAVVGGNDKRARLFSEYWTFLRTVGGSTQAGDANRCPSCGAPLDNVSQSGICGYCDSKITAGTYDWVLSRIEQAEGYTG